MGAPAVVVEMEVAVMALAALLAGRDSVGDSVGGRNLADAIRDPRKVLGRSRVS
jgi:hypothetical protein